MTLDIRNWLEIDAPYLTELLLLNGFDVVVDDFGAKPVGTGQIGDCVRFTIDYQSLAPNAPKTIIGKFPAEAEESRHAGAWMGTYRREVKFYQLLQPNARISTPTCYFTDVDEETHDFVLFMSDAAPAVQGDQLAGVSLEQMKTVLVEAAKLHSANWNNAQLNEYDWVYNTPKSPVLLNAEILDRSWAVFRKRYQGRVSERASIIAASFSEYFGGYDKLQRGARSLIHADFRPDNMLFASPQGGKPLTVVDWQSVAYGPPASDIGNFVAGALNPNLRRKNEDALLGLYAEALEAGGAGSYEIEELKRHYIAGAYQHFLTAVVASVQVTQTARGDEMFLKMLNGAVDMIFDHGAEEWLM